MSDITSGIDAWVAAVAARETLLGYEDFVSRASGEPINPCLVDFDMRQAAEEGWCIEQDEEGDLVIAWGDAVTVRMQMDYTDASLYVIKKAEEGSEYHAQALRLAAGIGDYEVELTRKIEERLVVTKRAYGPHHAAQLALRELLFDGVSDDRIEMLACEVGAVLELPDGDELHVSAGEYVAHDWQEAPKEESP